MIRATVPFANILRPQLGNELWPVGDVGDADTPQDSDDEAGGADDIEKQIAKEVAAMKRPRKETRFGMFGVIFHACRIS